MKLLVIVIVVAAILVGGYFIFGIDGCKARTEVAKDRIVAKIDAMLGSLDVKRKEVEIGVKGYREAIDGLRRAKIKAQVKYDQMVAATQPVAEKIGRTDRTLKKLRDYIAAGQPVEVAGKTYSQADLKNMADQVIKTRQGYTDQLEGTQKAMATLQGTIGSLRRKQDECQTHLTRLEGEIAQIDANMVAVRAMKDASNAMDQGEDSLSKSVAQLEEKVHSLLADTKAELMTEDEKFNEQNTTAQIDSVNAFITATQEPVDMVKEIDAILGNH